MRTIRITIGLLLLSAIIVKAQRVNIVQANQQFALDFYKQISANEKGNIFFSPISLSAAMSMAFAGAKGETQNQISSVFHFPSNRKKFHAQQGELLKQINPKNDSIQLNIVNTLWAEKTYPFKKAYNKLIKQSYSASIQPVDFINKYEDGRLLINDDIFKSTSEKIKDLLPAGSVNPLTKLVLTNAIYFKANWKTKFVRNKSIDAIFYITPQEKVKCSMMSVKGSFRYTEDANAQAVELPYSGGNYSIVVILPTANQTIEEYSKGLSFSSLDNLLKGLLKQEVNVSIPKFKLSSGYQLKQVLSDMGMPLPFTDKADFSGMTSKNDLKITDVFHKAFIEVNEEGTEASAATAVVIGLKSAGNEKYFIANRPFLFLIKDNSSGSILFMGRMVNPTKSE